MSNGGLGGTESLVATVQAEVGERYRVLSSLGTGGSGETFEAIRTSDGIPIALKRLVVAKAREWKTIEFFEHEARVLASLAHPSIPTFRESFVVESEAGTCLYLANDLAVGRSLRAWMELGWRADVAEIRRVAEFLLDTLSYLHSLSPPVVHRDIKPDNIIRGEDGRLSLVDFGAVRDFSSTMGSSTVVGTYGYMAPEQFRGQAVPASDIYAVAATLLHLMTGHSPHELPQAKLKVVFRPHVQAAPPFLAWLDRALEPSPEDRFATAPEALDALRGGVVASRTTDKPKTARGRILALLAVLTVIVASAGAFIVRDVRTSRLPAQTLPKELRRLPPQPWSFYAPTHYVRSMPGHMTLVLGIALSPDDKTAASGADGSVVLWDIASGDKLRTFSGHVGKVKAMAFTKDGKQLVTGDATTVRIWDVATGLQARAIEHPHTGHVMDLVLLPDGKTLYTCSTDGNAKAWDLESGRELLVFKHASPLYTLALSPNGSSLVTGGKDGSLQLWEALTGRRGLAWSHGTKPTTVNSISFAPDGSLLATSGDDHVTYVSQFAHAAVTPRYSVAATDEAWRARFSPDGRFLITTSKDHSIVVTEALDGGALAHLDAGDAAADAAFSRDGRSMLVAAGAYVQVYSLPYKGAGTKLPEPSKVASAEPPRAKNRVHGLYLEAMRLMLSWPVTSLDDAQKKLDEAIAIDGRSQVAWVGRAQLAIKRGFRAGASYTPESIAEAKGHLAQAASLGPKGAEYWSVAAWVARSAHDTPGVFAAAREAYKLEPDEPYAKLAEADAHNREGHHAAAIEAASAVVTSTRRVELVVWAHQFLSDAYAGLGDVDAADAAHRKQIELAPQNVWKRANYAHFLVMVAGDPKRAIVEAEKALAITSDQTARTTLAKAHSDLGLRKLWGAGDAEGALAEYEKSIAVERYWPQPYFGRAACWRAMAISRHDPTLVAKARADLKLVLEQFPKYTPTKAAMEELDAVEAAAKEKK